MKTSSCLTTIQQYNNTTIQQYNNTTVQQWNGKRVESPPSILGMMDNDVCSKKKKVDALPPHNSIAATHSSGETQEEVLDSVWWADANSDELRTFLLTESVKNFQFNQIWSILHHTLDWQYQQTKEYPYRSAPFKSECFWFTSKSGKLMYKKRQRAEHKAKARGEWLQPNCLYFKNSRDVQDCLEGVNSYTPPPGLDRLSENTTNIVNTQESQQEHCDDRLKCIRDDVLKLLYIYTMRKQAKTDRNSDPVAVEISAKSDVDDDISKNEFDIKEINTQKNRKRQREMNKNHTVALTSIEEGAEKYFHRKSTKSKATLIKKKSHRLKGTNLINTRHFGIIESSSMNEENSDNIDIKEQEQLQYQPWPSPTRNVMIMRNFPQKYEKEMERNFAEHKLNFPKWRFLLSSNHSLLLYGFGSKKKLLDDFANEELRKEGEVVVLNGYDKEMTIHDLMDMFVGVFLGGRDPLYDYQKQNQNQDQNQKQQQMYKTFGSSQPCSIWNPLDDVTSKRVGVLPFTKTKCPMEVQRAIAIAKKLSSRSRPIFIVIHNIDASLRSHLAQECLAVLTAYSKGKSSNAVPRMIRLVASVDHINASCVLWDVKSRAKFSWMWLSVSTYHPYHEEVYYGGSNPMSKHQKKEKIRHQNTGIQNILSSLAPRHAEVIKELASLQLAQIQQNGGQFLIPYKSLLKNCKKNMFISSDLGLRNVLRELEDHRIVEYQQEEEGEMIYIQYDADMLKTIIGFRRK